MVGACVLALDLKVQRADAKLAADIFDERQGAGAYSLTAVALPDIELVDKRVAPEALEAIPDRQHHIADRLVAFMDQPHAPERRLAHDRLERRPQGGLVERVLVVGVVLADEGNEGLDIFACCKLEAYIHRHSTIFAFTSPLCTING